MNRKLLQLTNNHSQLTNDNDNDNPCKWIISLGTKINTSVKLEIVIYPTIPNVEYYIEDNNEIYIDGQRELACLRYQYNTS